MESQKRSLFKTISWYAAHITVAMVVAFAITHDLKISAILASAEIIWEAALFYAHERAWARFGSKVR